MILHVLYSFPNSMSQIVTYVQVEIEPQLNSKLKSRRNLDIRYFMVDNIWFNNLHHFSEIGILNTNRSVCGLLSNHQGRGHCILGKGRSNILLCSDRLYMWAGITVP